MSKAMLIRAIQVSLFVSLLFSWPFNSLAQHQAPKAGTRIPWACSLLTPDYQAERDDPKEEQKYATSARRFYRLWCTSALSSPQAREDASNRMAEDWKHLWYRDEPFNAAFHETGSYDLLVEIAIMGKIPKPLIVDQKFMHDWLDDCNDRCFMIYGDDDPGANKEKLQMHRRRDYLLNHVEMGPATRPVLEMLKNAKLDPVN